MGSLDVLPFVPLEGATLDEATRLARQVERLGALGFLVYLYEAAATAPHRASRRCAGRLRRSRRAPGRPLWQPDYGPRDSTPQGAAVGARPFLVAFNAYLDTDEGWPEPSPGRCGSAMALPGVKALGLEVGGRAQVSMNLTDLQKTSMPVALEAVRKRRSNTGIG